MRFLKILLLLVLLTAAVAAYVLFVPYGPSQETFVDIAPGTSSRAIAAQLQHAGVLRSQYSFYALRFVLPGKLKAGEYRFDHAAKPGEVYDRLTRGDVYTLTLTVPEGYNLYDIGQAVQSAGLGTSAEFLAAAHSSTALIREWSPAARSLEGYLFPDTYRFSRHTTQAQMLAAMVKRFRSALAQLNLTDTQASVPRLVTMASLVEKEVHIDSERPTVAGVFENRIRLGMPLATDPTVIYAALLDGRWRGTIHASDLQATSPYNTYKYNGLPPGPICSPGMAALQAAAHPQQTDYLYFVADAQGHTRFSVDLKEHAQQVQEYRRAAASH